MKEESDLKILVDTKTDHQDLRLYVDPDHKLVLTLDTYVQFKEGEDERAYHRNLVDRAIFLHSNPRKFLILGGGDGLCSRNIFKIVLKAEVTLVDYDKGVVEFCKTDPLISILNQGSLYRGDFHYSDAKEWVKTNDQLFDIIILDLPDPTSKELKKLYTKQFYKDVAKHLEPGGIMSVQVHPDKIDTIVHILTNIIKVKEVTTFDMPWLTEGAVVIGQK